MRIKARHLCEHAPGFDQFRREATEEFMLQVIEQRLAGMNGQHRLLRLQQAAQGVVGGRGQGQAFGLLDDALVELPVLRRLIGAVDRHHYLARQGAGAVAHQIGRHRAIAQQVPIHRGEEGALEQRLLLHFLDQQIRLAFTDIVEDVLLQIIGPARLVRHLDTLAPQPLYLLLEPVTLLLQVLVPRRGPVIVFQQAQNPRRLDQRHNMQTRPTGPRQRTGMLDSRRQAQGRVDDQQQALVLAHGQTPGSYTSRIDPRVRLWRMPVLIGVKWMSFATYPVPPVGASPLAIAARTPR